MTDDVVGEVDRREVFDLATERGELCGIGREQLDESRRRGEFRSMNYAVVLGAQAEDRLRRLARDVGDRCI